MRIAAFVALMLYSGSTGSAQVTGTGWSMTYSASEGLQKLFYARAGAMHGDVYFRCTPGDGWIFLVLDDQSTPTETTKLQSSTNAANFTSRTEYDDFDQTFFTDTAIPASHEVMRSFSQGNALLIKGLRYPVSSRNEQRTISDFVRICGGV